MQSNLPVRSLIVCLFGCLLGISACTTKPKVDWNSRIGSYSYDQAVIDMGPPDRLTEISDGRKVGDWVTGTKSTPRFSFGVGSYGGSGGVGVGAGTGGDPIQKILRLTFDKHGNLVQWENTQR
jgi:hypothetical protein